MKKIPLLLSVGILGFSLTAAEPMLSQEELFKVTMSHLDMGGISLSYLNTQNWGNMLPDFFPGGNNKIVNEKFDRKLAAKFLEAVNFNAVQSIGFSGKSENGLLISKSFCYTGAAGQGLIFDLLGRKNIDFTLQRSVPQDAVFAVGLSGDLTNLWHVVNQLLKEQKFPDLNAILVQQFQISIDDLLASVSGEGVFFLTLSVKDGQIIPGFLLNLPDCNSVIAKLLARQFPDMTNSTVDLSMFFTDGAAYLKPFINVENKRFIFASNPEVFAASVAAFKSGNNIAANLEMKKYFVNMPATGTAYGYLNFDGGIFKSLLPDISAKTYQAYGIVNKEPAGYFAKIQSNFTGGDVVFNLTQLAELFRQLPADADDDSSLDQLLDEAAEEAQNQQ